MIGITHKHVDSSANFDGANWYTFGGLMFEERCLWAEGDTRDGYPGWIAIYDAPMGRLICQMSPGFFDDTCTGIWHELPSDEEGDR